LLNEFFSFSVLSKAFMLNISFKRKQAVSVSSVSFKRKQAVSVFFCFL